MGSSPIRGTKFSLYCNGMANADFQALEDISAEIRNVTMKLGLRNRPSEMFDIVFRIREAISSLVDDHDKKRLYEPCENTKEIHSMGLQPLTRVENDMAELFLVVINAAKDLGVDISYAVTAKHEYNKAQLAKKAKL